MMFGFLKRRKYRAVRFGECEVHYKDGSFTLFSVIFYENDNGNRKFVISGEKKQYTFNNTNFYAPCVTWKATGLFPEWSKDPLAEKLSR